MTTERNNGEPVESNRECVIRFTEALINRDGYATVETLIIMSNLSEAVVRGILRNNGYMEVFNSGQIVREKE